MSETADYDKSATPTAHAPSHQPEGTDPITDLGGGAVLIPCWTYDSVIQGSVIFSQGPWATFGSYIVYNNSNADGDEYRYKAYLPKGTYELWFNTLTDPAGGFVDVRIGGTLVGTLDTYGTGDNASNLSIAGISIASSGIKEIALKVHGHNPFSSGYFCIVGCLYFQRTA